LYLNENKKEYTHQNTKNLSSVDLVSSQESLSSLGYNPVTISHLPHGYHSYSFHDNIYNSTQSLQLQHAYQYSMPPQLLNTDKSVPPILSRFPSSLTDSNSRSNIQIYSQLQIPSTSNFGSMKKKKKDKNANDSEHLEEEISTSTAEKNYNTLIEHSAHDNTYIPEFISIKNKPVKV